MINVSNAHHCYIAAVIHQHLICLKFPLQCRFTGLISVWFPLTITLSPGDLHLSGPHAPHRGSAVSHELPVCGAVFWQRSVSGERDPTEDRQQ